MILSVFPTSIFAAEDEVKTKTEVVKSHKEGDKLVFDVLKAKNPRRYKAKAQGNRFFSPGAPATIDQKVKIDLNTVGLGENSTSFDWNLLPSGLKVTVYFTDQGGIESEKQVVTLTQSALSQEVTLKVPATGGTGKLHAEIPDIDNNLAIRVLRTGESTADTTVGKGDWSFTVSVSEIISPVINLEVKDPYGKPATAAGDVKAKLHVDGLDGSGLDIPFTISQGNTSFNLRESEILTGEDYDATELNYPGTNPTLTVEGETSGKLTLGTGEDAVEYKVAKTYSITVGGTITLTSQPKVIVPQNPTDKTPEGYVRVTFDPTTEGTIPGKAKGATKFYDVLKGTDWNEASFDGLGNPTHETKTFAGWFDGKTKLADKTGEVSETTFTAKYSEDIVPQKPGEDKPNVPANFVLVEFKAGKYGTIADTETTKYWVNPTKEVDLTEEAPEVTPTKKGVEHQGWDKALKAKFTSETEITATYKATIQDVNGADITNKDQTVREGDPIKDIVITPKDEEATITVDEKDLPEGVEYDKNNNKITGTPEINDWEDNEEERKIEIPVVVENPDGSKTTEKVTITVTKTEDVVPQKPGEEKPDVPANFVLVEFKAGKHGTIADTETTKYWVNPTKEVDLTEEAPEVTPTKKGVEHQGWDKALKAKFTSETEITATYKATIQDVNGADITNKDQTVREGDPIKDIVITPKDEEATITVDEKDLPEGVEYDKNNNKITGTPEINDWEDNEEERKIEIPVVVENPDGSKTTEKVTITVTKKTEPTPETKDNEKYEPETKPIVKDEGEKPSEDEIKDSVTVPGYPEDKEQPKVTIDDPTQIPDGNTPGEYEVDVTVEYPDGSKDKAKVKVTIKDKTTPTPQEPEQGGGDIFDGLFKRHDYTPTYPVKTVVPEKTKEINKLWYIFHIDEYDYEEVRNYNSTSHKMDVTPVIRNERTMLPLRYVAEAINAEVIWNAETRTATFTKDGLTASIQIDSDEIVLSNGKTVKMDSKPLNINDRILVSVVNVANVFGLTNGNTLDGVNQDIEWDHDTRTATIYIRR